ncbi:F-box protein isoform X2 [Tanacetum coccineum]
MHHTFSSPPPSLLSPLSSPLPRIPSPPLLLRSPTRRDIVLKADMPPQKRARFVDPSRRFEIRESSEATAARQLGSALTRGTELGFISVEEVRRVVTGYCARHRHVARTVRGEMTMTCGTGAVGVSQGSRVCRDPERHNAPADVGSSFCKNLGGFMSKGWRNTGKSRFPEMEESVNVEKALDSFLKGAACGSTLAMVDTGLVYWEIGKKDEGVRMYKRVVELGDPAGQCNLGISYLQVKRAEAAARRGRQGGKTPVSVSSQANKIQVVATCVDQHLENQGQTTLVGRSDLWRDVRRAELFWVVPLFTDSHAREATFLESAHVNRVRNTQPVQSQLPNSASLILEGSFSVYDDQSDYDQQCCQCVHNEPAVLAVGSPKNVKVTEYFHEIGSYHMLNSEDHANFLKKNNGNPTECRPDISHQTLAAFRRRT